MPTLNERMDVYSSDGMLFKLDMDILNSLNQSMEIRPYQKEAFRRFITYFEKQEIRRYPSQVLFHMATGSGKTYIMAGLILYLYKQGYRNFVFFVNSTNIIEKTKQNFLERLSSKYLFNRENVIIDGQIVSIKEVTNFQYVDETAINIIFTTTSKLHRDMNPMFIKENAPTLDDFEDKKIVLISDESHHLNVDTKNNKISAMEEEENESWETTVTKIFNLNQMNVLLEFTATCDTDNPYIQAKYDDKLIFDYPLRKFRIDKYSKEVKVFQSDANNFDRTIKAIIINQYRLKLFQKYGILIKPVIMFKSKTIAESKKFYNEFQNKLKVLNGQYLKDLLDKNSDESIIKKMIDYLENNNIAYESLVNELMMDFNDNHCVIVNNKEESEDKQIAVNTLEDQNNLYRAVFAVDKLNEGWDVLNLFDIVRLYDTRDAKNGKPGKTTISEAQLIGRGARYCPFKIDEIQDKYKRKYDDDLENELRICEELYYHSKYNPKYIQELGVALRETGIWSKDEKKPIALRLKKEFKDSDLYKNGLIFINERRKKQRSSIYSLPESSRTKIYNVSLPTGYIESSYAFEQEKALNNIKLINEQFRLVDLGKTVLLKAMRNFPIYEFRNLSKLLPNLKSLSHFINSKDYLGDIKVMVRGLPNDISKLSPNNKLYICTKVLSEISEVISSIIIEYEGSEEFIPRLIKETFKSKLMNLTDIKDEVGGIGVPQSELPLNNKLYLNLPDCSWYGYEDNYGTTEEKRLVVYLDSMINKLSKRFDPIVLLRNERFIKLFSFDDGQPFEPDYILFLQEKAAGKIIYYQLFIEPKGSNLIQNDLWKENFLLQIKSRWKVNNLFWENSEIRIWGLPFYNHEFRNTQFNQAVEELINED